MHIRTSDYLTLVTSSTATVDTSVSFRGEGAVKLRPGVINKNISTATTTTILPSASSAQGSNYDSRVVKSISIRNKDASTSCDVTVKLVGLDDTGAATTSEVIKATLAAGSHLFYDEARGWQMITAGSLTSSAVGSMVTVIATSDTTNSASDTLANVTGLSFPVTSGQTYRFRAVVVYTVDATTTGTRLTVNGPSMTAVRYRSNYALTTTSETVNNGLTSLQLPAAANATSAATGGNIAIVEGQFTPSADGTFAIQQACEAAGSVVAKAGSFIDYMRVA